MKRSRVTENIIQEIKTEMEELGVWKKQAPVWVQEYAERKIVSREDFAGWLQFVYLPNLVQEWNWEQGKTVALQAARFLGDDERKRKLLRLLIELDSLE